jgi:hypothetical protein
MTGTIKPGVYAAVSGTVARVFHYGDQKTGIEIHVKTERMKYPDRYTAFDIRDQVAEGDTVEVRGWLETQVEEFTKRDGSTGHGVKRTVNAPKLEKHEPATQAAGWGADSEEPF